MKKVKENLIFKYLKEDKLKLITYLILVFTSYIPSLGAAFFWGASARKFNYKRF